MAGAINPRFSSLQMGLVAVLGAALGCSAQDGDSDPSRPNGPDSFDNPVGGMAATSGGSGGQAALGGGIGGAGGSVDWADAGNAPTCASASTATELRPVHLAFAFDVSGSMGKGDEAWHDKALKWDPVVLATRTFFEDPTSDGLSASMTFF